MQSLFAHVIYLIEEYVLPITAFCRKILQIAILIYSMLSAQLLPELTANCSPFISIRCYNYSAPRRCQVVLIVARWLWGKY